MCFEFQDDFLAYTSPYKNTYWDDTKIKGGHFRNLLYLVQDFANQSNFRQFYAQNKEYYHQLIERQSALMPIQQMWDWLEKEFPQKLQHYKIVFSPLIVGSHSTQKFYHGFFRNPDYQECIMFINSPESLDSNDKYSEKLKEGLMSGIVFTEIDHNYVNPSSHAVIDKIKQLISDKGIWATAKAQKNYRSEYAIFNEYMTHSLFCLYIEDNYETELANQVIQKRIALMNRRGFSNFESFNQRLLDFRKQYPSKSIYFAYKEIINLMEEIK